MSTLGAIVYASLGLDTQAGLLPTACRRFCRCCCRRSDYILKTHHTTCPRARPKPHCDIRLTALGPLAAHCCCSCPGKAGAAHPRLLSRVIDLGNSEKKRKASYPRSPFFCKQAPKICLQSCFSNLPVKFKIRLNALAADSLNCLKEAKCKLAGMH